jgi:hypothetical protein
MTEASGNYEKRPIRVGWSVPVLLFASSTALVTWVHYEGGIFCTSELSHGRNIVHAFAVALVAGPLCSLLLASVRKHRRLLAGALLLGATALAVAIAFVALDSATYVATQDCGFMEDNITKFHDHLYYLYVLWGAPLGILLWEASRVLQSDLPKHWAGHQTHWLLERRGRLSR